MTNAASANPNTVFDPARIIEIDPGTCCAGAWANVSLTHWVSRGTVSAVECVARVGAELRAQYPLGTSAVHMIREGAGMPTPEVREGLLKLMNEKVERRGGVVGTTVGASTAAGSGSVTQPVSSSASRGSGCSTFGSRQEAGRSIGVLSLGLLLLLALRPRRHKRAVPVRARSHPQSH